MMSEILIWDTLLMCARSTACLPGTEKLNANAAAADDYDDDKNCLALVVQIGGRGLKIHSCWLDLKLHVCNKAFRIFYQYQVQECLQAPVK